MIFGCPGSQHFKSPEPRDIRCPACGFEAEIWTDELEVVCKACGSLIRQGKGQSCIDWCSRARECIGAVAYAKYMEGKSKETTAKRR
jgi:DNA-directed RNA polymerase subunit RPC12/RpoP